MEIGHQAIDDLELVAGRDEERSFGRKRMNNAIVVSGAFQQAQGCCADGNNAPALFFRAINLRGGLRGNLAPFRMHGMIL